MQAITGYQPYMTLIAEGIKTVETRSWRPPYALLGNRIAIHAGKGRPESVHIKTRMLAAKGN